MKRFLLLTFCIFYQLSTLSATIIRADDLTPIHKALYKVDKSTLVLFDVDDVLITSVRIMVHHTDDKPSSKMSIKKHDHLPPHSPVMVRHYRSVDARIPELVKMLNRKGIMTLGLTARKGSDADYTKKQLSDTGTVFKRWFSHHNGKSFKEFKSAKIKPLYKHGILFTGGESKGAVLKSFLKRTGHRPRKIVFIDDLHGNLVSVDNAMKSLGIPTTCFHFLQAKSRQNVMTVYVY